jgi:hypothetical protein
MNESEKAGKRENDKVIGLSRRHFFFGFPSSRFLALACLLLPARTVNAADDATPRVPILYSTDLFHPHDDPDDHFDLATLFAVPEFDIRGIVLDAGKNEAVRTGEVPLRQMMHLTGRQVPYARGLVRDLESLEDKATAQPAPFQGGVSLILKALRESKGPVTVFTTGSLRDVAAAFNREPALLRAKVARLYVNAGHSGGQREWNVDLDRHAYVRIMQSGLPIYWVPCFGPERHASLWKFRHDEILAAAPRSLQNFFIYALSKKPPAELDPIKALTGGLKPAEKEAMWHAERSMWCTGAFFHAAGRTLVKTPDRGWISVGEGGTTRPAASAAVVDFEKLRIRLNPDGTTRIDPKSGNVELLTFHRIEGPAYDEAMRGALRDLLAKMPHMP